MAGRLPRFEAAASLTMFWTQALAVEPCAQVRTVVPVRQTVPLIDGFEQTPVPGSHVPAV